MPQCPSPGTPHEQQRTAVEKQLRKAGGVTAVAALLEEYYRLSGSALSSDAQGLASFDGYFYINLADRHDRRAQIESMLQVVAACSSHCPQVPARDGYKGEREGGGVQSPSLHPLAITKYELRNSAI